MNRMKNYNYPCGPPLGLLFVLHAANGVSLIGTAPLRMDDLISIENFIATASISATTTLQASLLGCGTMSPKKQGGDRSEGLGDKDTKKGGLFASWRSTQLGHGRWPRDSAGCRWQIHMKRGLTLSQPVFMSQKSRGNICMALKSRRISLTRSNPTRNNKHTQTRKKSNRYYNHTKGKTFI